jgi:hypothetical protein
MDLFRRFFPTEEEKRLCSRTTAYENGLRTTPENRERLERSFGKWVRTQSCSLPEKDYWYAKANYPVRNIYRDASGANLICEDEEGRFEAWTVSHL